MFDPDKGQWSRVLGLTAEKSNPLNSLRWVCGVKRGKEHRWVLKNSNAFLCFICEIVISTEESWFLGKFSPNLAPLQTGLVTLAADECKSNQFCAWGGVCGSVFYRGDNEKHWRKMSNYSKCSRTHDPAETKRTYAINRKQWEDRGRDLLQRIA